MADPTGFLHYGREEPPLRPVAERVQDWLPAFRRPGTVQVIQQATRCMDCGVAFCHAGCPLGNLIPEWDDLVSRNDWHEASERLHATNNFPEFTGWLCPAPCEDACVVSLTGAEPVSIKQIELAIVDRAWDEGWIRPHRPLCTTGRRVAVVGSGPAGLAAAQQLTRAGHTVVVLERSDRPGGMLRYGIPDFKLDKRLLDRRLRQLTAEGTQFATRTTVGSDVSIEELRCAFDAVVVAAGALRPREVDLPGRELGGVLQAMDFLTEANRAVHDGRLSKLSASGRDVVIIGGGDTAADCLGTAHRQGATSVHVLDHNPAPPPERDTVSNPWPQALRTHSHAPVFQEGVDEEWDTEIMRFLGDGAGHVCEVVADRVRLTRTGTVRSIRAGRGRSARRFADRGAQVTFPADVVLLAAGFDGVLDDGMLGSSGVTLDPARGTIMVDDSWSTAADGVWACGDATRGASLIVWAIADGRACARAVDAALTGSSELPAPVTPASVPL